MVTSKDVAKLAGVSRATVSNVLSGTKYVSPELVKRVQDAVKKLNYRPHGIARSLVEKKTYSIGVLVPRIASTFYPPIVSEIEEVFAEKGYSIILCNSHEDCAREEVMLQVLSEKRVDGLIWVPCGEKNVAFVRSLNESGTPVVIVDRRVNTGLFDSVESDNYQAGVIAGKHLLALGWKKPLVLTFSLNINTARDRVKGFKDIFKSHEIEIDHEYVISLSTPEYEHAMEDIPELLKKLSFDSIFACSDLLTLAIVSTALRLGMNIGKDIGILGFDDSPWGSNVVTPLTVITQDTLGLGLNAARLLERRLGTEGELEFERISLPEIGRAHV